MSSGIGNWRWLVLLGILLPLSAWGDGKVLKMATTTSTENSGLLNVLLSAFYRETGIRIRVFAKGTGAALKDGMDGNVDVLFVHAKEKEEKFVSDGFGAYRLAVMHNDFVIVGPSKDPAQVKKAKDAPDALRRIAETGSFFISRGDDSGTHIKEQALWKLTGVPLSTRSTEIIKGGKKKRRLFMYPGTPGKWYISIGQGMGKTLTFAEEKQAYTLADRGTYLKYKFGRKTGLDLEVLYEGDARLFNPYGIIPVNPKTFPHVRFDLADTFAKWLVGTQGQRLIANYRIEGRTAFFPDALPHAK